MEAERREAVLSAIAAGKRSRWRRIAIPVLLAMVALGLGLYLYTRQETPTQRFRYVTAAVTRGDLAAVVSATGKLRAVDTVQVGAETNGKVRAVLAVVNDRVKAGQVLCEIDRQQLRAIRDQARAQLLATEAEHKNRLATAKEATLAGRRSAELARQGLVPAAELDTTAAAAERAAAAVEAAAAQIVVARAALERADTELEKATIRAPSDGVVLARAVEVGQTVIASLQAPVLFTLARDLRSMELTVSIDEADVGQVREGQTATFTVDAYPEKQFKGAVRLIQNVATVVDNVVTYEALIAVDNPELELRPGMTANVTVLTAERTGVLLVPNAALRFKPPAEPTLRPMNPLTPMRRPPMAATRPAAPDGPGVYRLVNGEPVRVAVKTGLSDGRTTEIKSGDLEAGVELVTDLITAKE